MTQEGAFTIILTFCTFIPTAPLQQFAFSLLTLAGDLQCIFIRCTNEQVMGDTSFKLHHDIFWYFLQ